MSPDEQINYLVSKLQTTIAEVRAVTGLAVSVEFNLYNHLADTREQFDALTLTADSFGAERNEWTEHDRGGYWEFALDGGSLVIHDDQMPHAPAVIPVEVKVIIP